MACSCTKRTTYGYVGIVLILQLWTAGFCYEDGGPIRSCTFLYPKHGADPQTSPSPFTFTTNATSYSPDDVIRMDFSSPTGEEMEGFMAHVRRQSGDTEELLGSFLNVPSYMKTYSWYPHEPGEQNCITHSSEVERSSFTLYWKAPSFSAGDLIMHATFMTDYDIFWVMDNSVSLTASVPASNPTFTAEATIRYQTVDTSSCGVSRGCFYYPRDCSGTDCQFVITYAIDEPNMTADIEMFGEAEGYVAIGFSDDRWMPDDHIYACIQSGTIYRVEHAHNPDYFTDRDRITEVSNVQVGRDGNNIYCKFTRPLVQSVEDEGTTLTYDMRDIRYLYVAWGDIATGSDGYPNQHGVLPIISDNMIDFSQSVISTGRSINVPLAVHASFGIISRMCLAGMAIIIARHFRFPFRKRILGRALWEQMHIVLNFATVALMVIACIILFAVLGRWSMPATLHAIIGLLMTVLMIALIISGFVAPKRSSKWRVYFDWGHRISGVAVFFLSIVCCILGFDVRLIERNLRWKELIILIVWMIFHIIWDVIFEILGWTREKQKAKQRAAEKAEKERPATGDMTVEDSPKKEIKKRSFRIEYIFLALYILINIIFTIISMFYLCTA